MYESKKLSSKAMSSPGLISPVVSTDEDCLLVELVEELEKINPGNKLARLNERSMVGKNGLRILF